MATFALFDMLVGACNGRDGSQTPHYDESIEENREYAMKLYHVEWCPDCEVVRKKLEEHDFTYDDEIVEDARPLRTQVHEASGQYYVPVLVDGETVLTETYDILAYLDKKSANDTRVDGQQESTPPLSSSDERN